MHTAKAYLLSFPSQVCQVLPPLLLPDFYAFKGTMAAASTSKKELLTEWFTLFMQRTKNYARLGSTIYECSPNNEYVMVPLPDLTFPQLLYHIIDHHGDARIKAIRDVMAAATLEDIAKKVTLFNQLLPEVELRRCVMYNDGIMALPTCLEELDTVFTRFKDLPVDTRPFLPQASVDVAWDPTFWTDRSHLSAWSTLYQLPASGGQ